MKATKSVKWRIEESGFWGMRECSPNPDVVPGYCLTSPDTQEVSTHGR